MSIYITPTVKQSVTREVLHSIMLIQFIKFMYTRLKSLYNIFVKQAIYLIDQEQATG